MSRAPSTGGDLIARAGRVSARPDRQPGRVRSIEQGVRVPGVISPRFVGGGQGQQLLRALGITANAAANIGALARENRELYESTERGLGIEEAQTALPELDAAIRDGQIRRDEGVELDDFVDSLIAERGEGLSETALEAFGGAVRGRLASAVVDTERAETKAQRAEVLGLISADMAVATGDGDIDRAITAARQADPDINVDRDLILPALTEAARAGQSEQFDRLAGRLPDSYGSVVKLARETLQVQQQDQADRAMRTATAGALDAAATLAAGGDYTRAAQTLRADIKAGRIDPSSAIGAIESYETKADQQARELRVGAEEALGQQVTAAITEAVDASSTPEQLVERLNGIVDAFPSARGDARKVYERAMDDRIDRLASEGDARGVRALRQITRDDDDAMHAKINKGLAEAARVRQRRQDAREEARLAAEFEAQASGYVGASINRIRRGAATVRDLDELTVRAGNRTETLSRGEAEERMWDSVSAEAAELFPDDPQARLAHQATWAVQSQSVNPRWRRTLEGGGGVLASAGGQFTAADFAPGGQGEVVARSYELYRSLESMAPDLLRTHMSGTGPAHDRFRLARIIERTYGVDASEALARAGRAADLEGLEISPSNPELRERVEKAFDGELTMQPTMNEVRAIATAIMAETGIAESDAIDEAIDFVREDSVRVGRHRVRVAGVPLDKASIRSGGESLVGWFLSTDDGEASGYDAGDLTIAPTPDGRAFTIVDSNGGPVLGAPTLTDDELASIAATRERLHAIEAEYKINRRGVADARSRPTAAAATIPDAERGVLDLSSILPTSASDQTRTIAEWIAGGGLATANLSDRAYFPDLTNMNGLLN